MAQLSEILPKSYGYVVLAVAGGSMVNVGHFFAVARARKEFRVKVRPVIFIPLVCLHLQFSTQKDKIALFGLNQYFILFRQIFVVVIACRL